MKIKEGLDCFKTLCNKDVQGVIHINFHKIIFTNMTRQNVMKIFLNKEKHTSWYQGDFLVK